MACAQTLKGTHNATASPKWHPTLLQVGRGCVGREERGDMRIRK